MTQNCREKCRVLRLRGYPDAELFIEPSAAIERCNQELS